MRDALRPVPTEPADPVYTLNITPSNEAACDQIAAGLDDPSKLRMPLDAARDLSRDLDASIELLTSAGKWAGRIERNGDFTLARD